MDERALAPWQAIIDAMQVPGAAPLVRRADVIPPDLMRQAGWKLRHMLMPGRAE